LGRRALFALAGLGAALIVAVPIAWASHQFTDVPDTNPFHGDIAAVKDAGITSGKTCVPPGTPPTYCPTEGITREAMAAFLHRSLGRVRRGTGSALIPASPVDLAVLTMDIGGVAGNVQFVKLDAVVTTSITSLTNCPCTTAYRIFMDGLGVVSPAGFNTNDALSGNGLGFETGATTALVAVPTASTQTFRLQAFASGSAPDSATGAGQLNAITAPFLG
jgi:hypothetical protein